MFKTSFHFFIVTISICLSLLGCTNSKSDPAKQLTTVNSPLLTSPFTLTSNHDLLLNYDVKGSIIKRMTITATVNKDYANLSVSSDGEIIADNLDLPAEGKQTINVLVNFKSTGLKKVRFKGRSADVTLLKIQLEDIDNLIIPEFVDASIDTGLITSATFKYGGPSVGDIDNDGDYDFVLNNHNHVPTQLVTNQGNGSLNIQSLFSGKPDLHGSALGDYDGDGDLDIVVAHGGANGTNPSSYTLFQNNNMVFTNATKKVGIKTPARGRAPRWIDLDVDGDLDLVFFNAKTPNYDGPQTLFLNNNGNGTFAEVRIKDIETPDASKALIVDFNNDGKDDILMYYPDALTLWQNNGDFTFTNVSKSWLPEKALTLKNINAVTHLDVNNDGLVDLYFANGRSHYSISHKSIDFSPKLKKLDINDDGETGSTQIDFTADNKIQLANAKFVFRQYREGFPLFLGENKTKTFIQPHDYHKNENRYPTPMELAPHDLEIAPEQANGWPIERQQNGLYLGYLGNKQWKAEWVRNKNIYWSIEFSISGINNVNYDWSANNRNVQDMLLINRGNHFTEQGKTWNIPQGGNHWGVNKADFNNDGWQDLFIHRYGYLKERIADLLLLNNAGKGFELVTSHGATDINDPGHGDMGQAFDFNQDGLVDMLNGSEDKGRWYLYLNNSVKKGNFIQIHVGYSPEHNVDPLSAKVIIETASGQRYEQTVGSSGEAHSQSSLNTLHFGLGKEQAINFAKIVWRNGEQKTLKALKANKTYTSNK